MGKVILAKAWGLWQYFRHVHDRSRQSMIAMANTSAGMNYYEDLLWQERWHAFIHM